MSISEESIEQSLNEVILETPPSQVEFDDYYDNVNIDDILGQNAPPYLR